MGGGGGGDFDGKRGECTHTEKRHFLPLPQALCHAWAVNYACITKTLAGLGLVSLIQAHLKLTWGKPSDRVTEQTGDTWRQQLCLLNLPHIPTLWPLAPVEQNRENPGEIQIQWKAEQAGNRVSFPFHCRHSVGIWPAWPVLLLKSFT